MTIGADKANAQPSAHILKRSAKMRAELLQHITDFEKITDVKVETDEPEKVTHIVRFIWEDERGRDLRIICFEEESLANCPANKFGRLCSHCLAAINKLLEIHNEQSAAKESEEQ